MFLSQVFAVSFIYMANYVQVLSMLQLAVLFF